MMKTMNNRYIKKIIMKRNYFFIVLVNFSFLFFSSCKTQDPTPTIKLDKTKDCISVTQTLKLNATTTNQSIITWSSSNPTIATVSNGLVTPVKAGIVDIVASDRKSTATCNLTITQGTAFRSCLTGTDYFLISMDNLTAAIIGDKIVADYRPNNNLKSFDIWNDTYTTDSCKVPNFFGENQNWINLVVNNNSWSGGHFYCADVNLLEKFAPIEVNSAHYYLHIGIQSGDSTVFLFGLFDEPGMEFAVGSKPFNDNGVIVQPLADFPRDGQWHEVEIPLYELKTEQFQYNTSMGAKNVLWFLSGPVQGTKVNVDALFIYKKAS